MPSNKTGRPYTQGITEALLQAAERVMVTDGYSALTIDAIATEVGTTRPTFYRRFPSIAHLALEVIARRFEAGTTADTGSLGDDLLMIQREDVAMYSSPLLRKNLPGLLAATSENPALSELLATNLLDPRRERISVALASAIDRGEIDPGSVDLNTVCDQLRGPLLARALLTPGAALDDRLARDTAAAALATLRTTRPLNN